MKNNRIYIADVTLRDGEQAPGGAMFITEKIKVAEALDTMGVDIIEAGFAASSQGDFESIQSISKVVKNATICSLARTIKADIDTAIEAVKHAKNKRIHIFVPTSPLHMTYKLNKKPDEVLEMTKTFVSHARNFVDDVEWSAEDATRSDIDFLCRCIETAIESGARTINLPDTVGYATPLEYCELFKTLIERIPNSDKAVFSAHCHNDLGMATANSLAAISGGARQIECTINGIGERAGNAALEEVVMAVKTRKDRFPFATGINTTHISSISKLVSNVTDFSIQKHKAIVGANAFAHSSGIHQDGILKNSETYEIMTPESIGVEKTKLVLSKHSGRAGLKDMLDDYSIDLTYEDLDEVFEQFKKLCDYKKIILDIDILELVRKTCKQRKCVA